MQYRNHFIKFDCLSRVAVACNFLGFEPPLPSTYCCCGWSQPRYKNQSHWRSQKGQPVHQKTTSNYRSQVDQSHATQICRKPHSSHSENASPFRWPKTHPLSLPADHPASNDWFRLASIGGIQPPQNSQKYLSIEIGRTKNVNPFIDIYIYMISYDLRVNM